MPKIDHNTKDRILAAAEKVFHANGFKGARTSLIAEEAGISRTMMHYYFNSKEELFQEVLKRSVGVVLEHAQGVLNQPRDLKEMVNGLIDLLCDVCALKPGLPTFVVNIFNESPEIAYFMAMGQSDELPKVLDRLLEESKQQGTVQADITGEHLMLHIYGLCSMAYLAHNYIKAKEKRSDEAMAAFLEERRVQIKSFVWHALGNQGM